MKHEFHVPPDFDPYATALRLGLVAPGEDQPDTATAAEAAANLLVGWRRRQMRTLSWVGGLGRDGTLSPEEARHAKELVNEAYRAGLRVWLYVASFPVQLRQLPEELPPRLKGRFAAVDGTLPSKTPADLRCWCELAVKAMEEVFPRAYPAPLFLRVAGGAAGEAAPHLLLVDLPFLDEVSWLFPRPEEEVGLDTEALAETLHCLRWSYLDAAAPPDSHASGRRRFNYPGVIRVTWMAARELACRLGDTPPPEPAPADGDHAHRNALDQVIAWCRRHEARGARREAQRPKSAGEAEAAVRAYLEGHPDAPIRDVARATGVPQSRISPMPVWQAALTRRGGSAAGRMPPKWRHRPLSDQMLAAVGTRDDLAECIDRRDMAWRRILEAAATDQERGRLNAMSPADRLDLIETELEQWEELALAERGR